jgi:hypothetical protein
VDAVKSASPVQFIALKKLFRKFRADERQCGGEGRLVVRQMEAAFPVPVVPEKCAQ